MPPRRLETAEALRRVAGESFTVHVQGTSMLPVLRDGDVLRVVRTAGAEGCALGDLVVLVRPDAGLVVHRLLWAGATHVRTRGDGSGLMDAPIRRSDVLGRVVAAERQGRDVLPGRLERRISWVRAFTAAGLRWGARRAARFRGRLIAAAAPRAAFRFEGEP